MAKYFEREAPIPNQSPSMSPQRAAEDLKRNAEIIEQRRAGGREMEEKKGAWRNALADMRDARRAMPQDELLARAESGEEEPNGGTLSMSEILNPSPNGEITEEVEVTEENPVTTEDELAIEDTSGSTVITKTINGVKVSRTVDEWLAIATKVEDADSYYQEAAKTLQERRQNVATQEVIVDQREVLKELAKKISLGSEDEAADAAAEMIRMSANAATAEARARDQYEAGKAVYMTFARDYEDLISDPITNAALNQIDQQMIAEGKVFDADPIKNFDKRLRTVGDQVRNWKKGVADVSIKEDKKQDLINKKAQINNLNSASQRQAVKTEVPLSEREARNAAVQGMFEARKKKAF